MTLSIVFSFPGFSKSQISFLYIISPYEYLNHKMDLFCSDLRRVFQIFEFYCNVLKNFAFSFNIQRKIGKINYNFKNITTILLIFRFLPIFLVRTLKKIFEKTVTVFLYLDHHHFENLYCFS